MSNFETLIAYFFNCATILTVFNDVWGKDLVDKYHSLSNLVSLDNQPTKLTNKYSLEENKERDTKNQEQSE